MASSGRTTGTGTGTTGTGIVSNAPRRGSNTGTLFSGLINQKRNSVDAAARARRESFQDMKPAPGVIGKMWHNFTLGLPSK